MAWEEWVPTRMLMCPWGERRAFLRDESRWDALREAAALITISVFKLISYDLGVALSGY